MQKKKILKLILLISSFVLIFASLCGVFLAGKYASSTNLDSIATAQKDTVKTNKASYLGLCVEENDQYPLPNHEKEFFANYSTFRQDIANFIPGVNVDKKIGVFFNEIEVPKSLSFFYFGPIKSDANNKDFIYPFQYMFKSVKSYPKNKYVINISQSQANMLLAKRGLNRTTENYYSLLFTPTSLKVDGIDYDFQIGNIFLEENYYYQASREMLDEFVMVSYFYPSVLKKQHIYLLNGSDFQNVYYMNYINSIYTKEKNEIFVNHNNLTNKTDDKRILSFYYDDLDSKHNLAVSICCISGVLCILSLLSLCLVLKTHQKILYWIPLAISTLLPFAIFKIRFNMTNDRFYFSSFSSNVNTIIAIGLFVTYFVFFLVYKYNKHNKKEKVVCSNI